MPCWTSFGGGVGGEDGVADEGGKVGGDGAGEDEVDGDGAGDVGVVAADLNLRAARVFRVDSIGFPGVQGWFCHSWGAPATETNRFRAPHTAATECGPPQKAVQFLNPFRYTS